MNPRVRGVLAANRKDGVLGRADLNVAKRNLIEEINYVGLRIDEC